MAPEYLQRAGHLVSSIEGEGSCSRMHPNQFLLLLFKDLWGSWGRQSAKNMCAKVGGKQQAAVCSRQIQRNIWFITTIEKHVMVSYIPDHKEIPKKRRYFPVYKW